MRSVRGFFVGPNKRPYVKAFVSLPRLGVQGFVDLMVDTGADATTIHWGDRDKLRHPDDTPMAPDTEFETTGPAFGIAVIYVLEGGSELGASVQYGVEKAAVQLRDSAGGAEIEFVLARVALDRASTGVPSLLGRDLLGDRDLVTDRSGSGFTLGKPD